MGVVLPRHCAFFFGAESPKIGQIFSKDSVRKLIPTHITKIFLRADRCLGYGREFGAESMSSCRRSLSVDSCLSFQAFQRISSKKH